MEVRWPMLAALVAAVTIPLNLGQEEPPWWAAISSYHFPHLYATDIEDFVPQLQNSTADYILIDFYAPWCPHCQHFAPDYERLALAIQRYDAANSKEPVAKKLTILSGTVDCVKFAQTCDFWGVHSYPTLMWGRRDVFLTKALQPNPTISGQSDDDGNSPPSPPPVEDDSDVNVIQMDGTAESVVKWINNRTKAGLDISNISKKEVALLLHQGQSYSKKASTATHHAATVAADVWDAQLATVLFLRDILEHHAFEDEVPHSKSRKGRRKKVKPGLKSRNTTRSAFVDFVGLLGARFPSSRVEGSSCRNSLAGLHRQLRHGWHDLIQEVTTVQNMQSHARLVMIDPDNLENQWEMCDRDWSRFKQGWHQCRGTWPGKRGYTCGLWNVFHFLAAQTTDETALSDLQTVRSTIAHFFDCQECRDHFMQIPIPEAGTWTRRDAQLWWWNAHNVVNRRVGKLEDMYDDGDPGFPKAQWPTEADCPNCRRSSAAPLRRLRLRGKSPDTISASVGGSGTVSAAPDAAAPDAAAPPALEGKPVDVPVESVTLVEAVAREGWNLDEVAAFLDKRYGGPSFEPMF